MNSYFLGLTNLSINFIDSKYTNPRLLEAPLPLVDLFCLFFFSLEKDSLKRIHRLQQTFAKIYIKYTNLIID